MKTHCLFIKYACKYILTIMLSFASISIFAQSESFFTVNKELPSSSMTSICQDYVGNIWIGSENGLCRYDGAKFRIYRNIKNDPHSILNNMITTLCTADNGNLYVGFSNGMQVLDISGEHFENIDFIVDGKVLEVYVKTIIELKNHNLLIGTLGHGLFYLKRGALKALPYGPSDIEHCFVYEIHEDKSGILWVSTKRKGLLRIEGKKITPIKDTQKIVSLYFRQISEDEIFIGSEKGLYRYCLKSNEIDIVPGSDKYVVSCMNVYKNKLLIGTENNGLRIYDLKSKRLIDKEPDIFTINQSKSTISFIFLDKAGNRWIGINRKGILMKPSMNNNFKYIGPKSVNKNVIGDNCVISLYKDKKDNLWVATDNDGIYCIDSEGKQKFHYSNDKGSNIPNSINTICEGTNDELWLGSSHNGIAKLDVNSGKCVYVEELKGLTINGLACDNTGCLWVGTMGNGLYKLNKKGEVIYKAPMESGKDCKLSADLLHNSWICSLLISKDNKLYISTCYGLGCYDLNKKSFVSNFKKNCILLGMLINVSFEDSRNIIWIGTSQGLYSFNPKDGKIIGYKSQQGIGRNVVCGITEDNDGNIWVSTNNGLFMYDVKKGNFANYYASDGLQGNEFTPRAYLSDSKGILYFGGVNGLTYFNPSLIRKSIKQLRVRITDFYINNQIVESTTKSGGHSIISKDNRGKITYHLGASDNSFCIEFANNSFCNTESTIYEYSLDSQDWNTLQPGVNKVYFSNMNPGKYSFKIRAHNYDTMSPEYEISIVIDSYWYCTWWAIILYLLIAVGMSSYIYVQIKRRRIVKAQLQEQVQKDKINEAKLQFFINISHEIRTPMTLIMSPLKKLLAMDKNEECQKQYHIIYRSADRILMLINQLMDIRKIDKGQMELHFQEEEIVPFVKKIIDLFEETLKVHEVKLDFEVKDNDMKIYIDPLYFDKVIINLMSNAIKYTPEGGEIGIFIKNVPQTEDKPALCQIEIYDNGIGIPQENIERIFERFYQINNNLNESKIGTGVGLHLTRSLVELHHGKIWAENRKNGSGVCFFIQIPIGKEHLSPNEISVQAVDNKYVNDKLFVHVNEQYDQLPSKCKTKHSLLIVEDDSEIRNYLNDELRSEFRVSVSTNGKDAMDSMLNDMPDLVISDIMMPVMDGITLCHKIKQNINLNHIPIILLTAKTAEIDTMEGLDMGADAYMTKPFNMQILHSTIVNLLVNREKLKNIYQGSQSQQDKVVSIELKSPDDKLLERVMKYMNKNLDNSDYTVEMLAQDVGLSRVHLHRKLKELTNQTTRDFMRNVRLQKAAELLSNKKISISDISRSVGFQNMTYFSFAFKELYGLSPKEYREK